MFKELNPIVAERKLHIVAAAGKDGKLLLYIEPAKKDDKESDAFVTPFSVQATAEELDSHLPAILTEWVAARKQVTDSLQSALESSKKEMERRAEEAKKKAAESSKKVGASAKSSTPAKPDEKAVAPSPTPSLLDKVGGSDGKRADGEGTQEVDVPQAAAPAAQQEAASSAPIAGVTAAAPAAVIAASDPATDELF